MNQALWGIDLGGTKIEGVFLESITDPTPLSEPVSIRRPIKDTTILSDRSPNWCRTGTTIRSSAGAIGIGTPGVLDPTLQTMKNCNTTALNGKPLQKDLEAG